MTTAWWEGDLLLPQGATDGDGWPPAWNIAEGEPPGLLLNWPVGWSARMDIRSGPLGITPGALLASLTTLNGMILLQESSFLYKNNTVQCSKVAIGVPPEVSSAWTWRLGFYAVELVSVDRVIRLAEGTIRLDPEVTHA